MKYTLIAITLVFTSLTACNSAKDKANSEVVESTEIKSERLPEKKKYSQLERRFAKMDANKDNKLEKSELKDRFADQFDEVDTDSDGFISIDELKVYSETNKGKKRSK